MKYDEKGKVLDENFKEGEDYELVLSSASTPLSEILGIIYGGLSSRFWMVRKHMISYNVKSCIDDDAAFFAWQCKLHYWHTGCPGCQKTVSFNLLCSLESILYFRKPHFVGDLRFGMWQAI